MDRDVKGALRKYGGREVLSAEVKKRFQGGVHVGSHKRVLLVTDKYITLLSGKKETLFRWLDIVKGFKDEKGLYFEFGMEKTLLFGPLDHECNIDEIFETICILLQHIMTEKEYIIVEGLQEFKPYESRYTFRSAMSRFEIVADMKKVKLTEEARRIVRRVFMTKGEALEMERFVEPDGARMMPVIIATLPIVQNLESVSFINCEKWGIAKDLEQEVAAIYNLYHVALGTRTRVGFVDSMKVVIEKSPNMAALSFTSVKLEDDDWDELGKVIGASNIHCLGFNAESINPEGMSKFYSGFLKNSDVAANISVLIFDGLQGIDVKKLINSATGVAVLSFCGCGLNIGEIFDEFEKVDMRNLTELYVSNNTCRTFPRETMRLQGRLSKVVASSVTWQSHVNFVAFLKLMFDTMNLVEELDFFELGVAFADIPKDDWSHVFEFLKSVECENIPLSALSWTGNPSHRRLLAFMSRCHELSYLEIGQSYNRDTTGYDIDQFCEYVKGAEFLKTLVMRGGPDVQLAGHTRSILKAVQDTAGLTDLDISFNGIGDEGIDDVRGLLTRRPLERIAFDGSNPTSLDKIQNIAESFKMTRVTYPFADVYNLIDNHGLESWNIESLAKAWPGGDGDDGDAQQYADPFTSGNGGDTRGSLYDGDDSDDGGGGGDDDLEEEENDDNVSTRGKKDNDDNVSTRGKKDGGDNDKDEKGKDKKGKDKKGKDKKGKDKKGKDKKGKKEKEGKEGKEGKKEKEGKEGKEGKKEKKGKGKKEKKGKKKKDKKGETDDRRGISLFTDRLFVFNEDWTKRFEPIRYRKGDDLILEPGVATVGNTASPTRHNRTQSTNAPKSTSRRTTDANVMRSGNKTSRFDDDDDNDNDTAFQSARKRQHAKEARERRRSRVSAEFDSDEDLYQKPSNKRSRRSSQFDSDEERYQKPRGKRGRRSSTDDDDDMYGGRGKRRSNRRDSDDDRRSPSKKAPIRKNMLKASEINDDRDFVAQRPDWTFPLPYIPVPGDKDEIVDELQEKFSVGKFLQWIND